VTAGAVVGEPPEERIDAADLHRDGLYHLVTGTEWVEHRRASAVVPESLASEGFVHCSWGRQVAGTVARHFAACEDLLVLELDVAALGDVALVEEDTTGSGQTFPHLYGPVPLGAVVSVARLR